MSKMNTISRPRQHAGPSSIPPADPHEHTENDVEAHTAAQRGAHAGAAKAAVSEAQDAHVQAQLNAAFRSRLAKAGKARQVPVPNPPQLTETPHVAATRDEALAAAVAAAMAPTYQWAAEQRRKCGGVSPKRME
ncbi:hypothetical protein LTR53_007962, partial [Teratosphaeriaceae sp. CCFEE 6253]